MNEITNTTPLQPRNIDARPSNTVVLTGANGAPMATLKDLFAARNAKNFLDVNPKSNWFFGCFTRTTDDTTKMTRELLYCFCHPHAGDLPDVLPLVEALRERLHPDDRTKLTYSRDEYNGPHIKLTGVDETPLELYAEPQEAAKRATEGIERASARPLTEEELSTLYLEGELTKDAVFKSASRTKKALLGQLVAAST